MSPQHLSLKLIAFFRTIFPIFPEINRFFYSDTDLKGMIHSDHLMDYCQSHILVLVWLLVWMILTATDLFPQGRFQGNGAAGSGSGQCVSVEDGINFRAGSVFAQEPISLNEDHVFSTRITPGCREIEGEGIVFTFQAIGPFAGAYTSTMGYRGLGPSIGIELDLETDEEDNDPPYDHLAVVANGMLDHNAAENLLGPIRVLPGVDDIEDCQIHYLTINWIARDQQLEVYFDCQLRFSNILDLSSIPDWDNVYWGLTAGVNESGVIYTICPDYIEELTFEREINICKGGMATLTASRKDVEYQWFEGDNILAEGVSEIEISAVEDTVFRVISRDTCFRRYLEIFRILVSADSLPLDLSQNDNIICEGEIITLEGNVQEASYEWGDGSTDSRLMISDSGTYRVTATLGTCINTDSITVFKGDIPDLNLGEDRIQCEGTLLTLSTGLDNRFNHEWSTGQLSNSIVVSEEGSYSVDIFNECGITSDEIAVSFENCIPLYIPDVFTPDDNGINDVFEIYSEDDNVRLDEWLIYDRWGTVMHSQGAVPFTTSVSWDGRSGSRLVPSGVYTYSVKITLSSGRQVSANGSFTLIR